MDNAIEIFSVIRRSLGTLQITSTRSNLDTLLGCMQLCDRGIAALQQEKDALSAESTENAANEKEGEEE